MQLNLFFFSIIIQKRKLSAKELKREQQLMEKQKAFKQAQDRSIEHRRML
ncbi:YrzI family small protein [Alkalicoccus daliensis]|nr:YrzI family small protein [Alkalicoccus daliensis]